MDILSFILLLGAIHGVFLSIVLVTLKNTRTLANRLLALILIMFSTIIIVHALFHQEADHNLTKAFSEDYHLITSPYIFDTLALMIGPLTYYYFKAIVDPKFTFQKGRLIHFIPAIVCFAVLLTIAMITGGTFPGGDRISSVFLVIRGFVFVQFLFYIILMVRYGYEKVWATKNLDLGGGTVQWLSVLIASYVVIWSVAILLSMTDAGNETWNYVWVISSVLIYACGYLGLRQPGVFQGTLPSKPEPEEKYKKSILSVEKADEYVRKLRDIMDQERPYLNAELSLPIMAAKLKIPVHHLSQVINEQFHQNFSEYVNYYRVSHARVLLQDESNDHLKIAEIGYQSGFNSLSVFNTAFKKVCNKTPRQFREEN